MTRYHETIEITKPDAPWITMVHAMTQDRRVFSAQIDAFRDDYRILLIDLPGHGLASTVPGPYGHMEMALHVRNVMDQVDIGPSHYWATHTGTAIGLLLAAGEPERFTSLILESAVISGFPMPYVGDTLAKASDKARSEGILAAIRDIFFQADWYDVMRSRPDECRAEAHWAILKDFAGAPWTDTQIPQPAAISDDELSAIQIPTLVYNGEHDLEDFNAVATHLEKTLPHAERAIIPEAGGFPAWEFPDQVNFVVADFITRHS